MNPLIQLKKQLQYFSSHWPALRFSPERKRLSRHWMAAMPGANTAEGQNALLSLTTGTYNTALGLFSLESLTDGSFNTGLGAGTLLVNTADQNTATGVGALLSNTTGEANTADGAFVLFGNTEGSSNTANGDQALITAGSSMNAAFGGVSAGALGNPEFDVTQSGGGPCTFVAPKPRGSAGGVTPSKFSLNSIGLKQPGHCDGLEATRGAGISDRPEPSSS